ncbi:taste receptor type 2 member 1-like [Lithobates pipiens]
MASLYIIIPLVFHLIFFTTGSIANVSILSFYFLDWMKTRKLSPVDLIINSIAIMNLFLQGSTAFSQICALLFLEFYIQVWVINSLVVILTSLALSSLCCSTCLCFYYCVKITSFKWAWFYKIKAKLPVMVPWLLFFSCTISWAFGLAAYWEIYLESSLLSANATRNVSYVHLNYKSRCDCIFQIYMLAASVPFTIIFITAAAIIFSLCNHMQRTKKNNEGSGNSKISSHFKATKTVTSLLIVYFIFYGMLNMIYSEIEDGNELIFIFCFIVAAAFPTENAIILISGNRKLLMMLKHLFCIKQTSLNAEVTVITY